MKASRERHRGKRGSCSCGQREGEAGTKKKVINFVTPILFARRRFQPRTFVIVRPQNYSNGRGERIHSCIPYAEAVCGKIEGRPATGLIADRLSSLLVPVTDNSLTRYFVWKERSSDLSFYRPQRGAEENYAVTFEKGNPIVLICPGVSGNRTEICSSSEQKRVITR